MKPFRQFSSANLIVPRPKERSYSIESTFNQHPPGLLDHLRRQSQAKYVVHRPSTVADIRVPPLPSYNGMLSPPVARNGTGAKSSKRVMPSSAEGSRSSADFQPPGGSISSPPPHLQARPSHRKHSSVSMHQIRELQAVEYESDIHPIWLNFQNPTIEQEYRHAVFDAKYYRHLYEMVGMLSVVQAIVLSFTAVGKYDAATGSIETDTYKVAMQGTALGLTVLLAATQFFRQSIVTELHQRVFTVLLLVNGLLWSFSSCIHNSTYLLRTEAQTLLIWMLVVQCTVHHLLLYIYSSAINIIVCAVYIASAVHYHADVLESVYDLVWPIVTVISAAIVLVYHSHSMETIKRQSFISAIRVEAAKKEKQQWNQEAMEMRGHMYVMTLEHYNIADMEAAAQQQNLQSPMEQAMAKLQLMCRDKIQQLPKDIWLDLQKVISWLGTSSDVFKPKISEAIADGNVRIDRETERWINGIVGDDDQQWDKTPSRTGDVPDQVDPAALQSTSNHGASKTQAADLISIYPHAPNSHNRNQTFAFNANVVAADERLFAELVNNIDNWNFDVFEVANVTKGRPLLFIGTALFKRYNLLAKFNVDRLKLTNFLTAVENGYQKNCPYHNSVHASDVARTCHYFLNTNLKSYCNELEILALVVASIIHDYDHPGLNNPFHIAVRDYKAILYNDRSVLENHHVAQCFFLLQKDENNIFDTLAVKDYPLVRKLIIELVLATDLGMHFDVVGQFKNAHSSNSLDKTSDKSRLLIMKMALKCADLGHSAKTLPLHEKWSARIAEEFYRQGDEERKRKLPISPFMDRQKANLPQSQVGFMDFLVIPLFTVFCKFLELENETDPNALSYFPCMTQVKANRDHWQQMVEENNRQESNQNKDGADKTAADKPAVAVASPRRATNTRASHSTKHINILAAAQPLIAAKAAAVNTTQTQQPQPTESTKIKIIPSPGRKSMNVAG